MITIKKIKNEKIELSIGEEVEIFDSFDSIVIEKDDFFEIWLTDTKYYNKETIRKILSCNWKNICQCNKNFKICFSASIFEDAEMPNSIINWLELKEVRDENFVILHTYSLEDIPYFWKERWSAKLYFDLIEEKAGLFEGVEIEKEFTFIQEKRVYSLAIKVRVDKSDSIKNSVNQSYEKLKKLHKITASELKGFTWKSKYETNESYFSQDFLLPLLRKLGFDDVHYNHGRKEYGKDFVFAEINKFEFEVYYGVQVKKGDLRGSVNSQIDEIIGQIEDAFSMPFYTLNSKEPKFISTFVVAISGKYSENAKEKIIRKISNRYGKIRGSIFFLDKEKLIELMTEK